MPNNRDIPPDPSAFFDAIRESPDAPAVDEGKDWLGSIVEETQGWAGERARKEKQKNDERFRYAGIFVRLSTIWLIFIGLVIVAHGLSIVPFSLSNTILSILLGTTTLNVLGPYFWIARYLFNGHSKKQT